MNYKLNLEIKGLTKEQFDKLVEQIEANVVNQYGGEVVKSARTKKGEGNE